NEQSESRGHGCV
nr:immunoglobulin heavy chain junction region [Homo sapiens]